MDTRNRFRNRLTPGRDVLLGAEVGSVACAGIAALFGPAMMIALGVALGGFAGAVLGLMLWLETVDLPEEAIVPPAPGNARRPGDD